MPPESSHGLEPFFLGRRTNRCLIGCSGVTWAQRSNRCRIKRLEEEPGTNPAPSVAAKLSQKMPSPSGGSTLSYTSTFVPKSFPSIDPKERRKRLRAMAKEAFPPGKPFLDPYTSVRVTLRSDDIAVNKPSFITATCTVKPLDDDSTLEHIQWYWCSYIFHTELLTQLWG